MTASLKVDASGLRRLAAKFSDPEIRNELMRIPHERGVAALIGQAVADNFEKQGPGWAPLKAKTIRSSVKNREAKKAIADMTDKELLAHEAKHRKAGSEGLAHRMILQRTGLLKKTATIPGYSGASKAKKGAKSISGANVWKVEGSKLTWASGLPYADAQNSGNPKKNLPAREFMTLRPEWRRQVFEYVFQRMTKIIVPRLIGRGK